MKIKPLKDFEIYQDDGQQVYHYKLVKGEEIEISEKFLANLITEGVISSTNKENKEIINNLKKGK
jgi:hypothetical protein